MSGLEPIPQRNEEEILKQMLKDRSILELEDRLGIKIPIGKDQSEEDLINRVLQMTGRSIRKEEMSLFTLQLDLILEKMMD